MPEAVLMTLLRRLLIQAGTGADQMGQRTVRPIVRAICDQKGGRRVFHLIGPLEVVIQRETIEIGVSERCENT